jgi:hypothetical protein
VSGSSQQILFLLSKKQKYGLIRERKPLYILTIDRQLKVLVSIVSFSSPVIMFCVSACGFLVQNVKFSFY